MSNIDMSSIVKVSGGKSMTMIEFCDKYGLNLDGAIPAAELLLKRGQLILVDTSSNEEKILNEALEENGFQETVNALDQQEEAFKQRKRQARLSETDSHSFTLDFVTTLDATGFEVWVNSLGVNQTGQFQDDLGAIKLAIKDVTPQEYTKITNRYKAENAVNSGMKMTNQIVRGTTNTINYGLTNVVSPTAKIVGEAGVNLGKGLIHTGIKTMAGLVNSTAKAVVDTKIALATDPECLRATNQLIDVKNGVKRGVAKKMNQSNFGNGINAL